MTEQNAYVHWFPAPDPSERAFIISIIDKRPVTKGLATLAVFSGIADRSVVMVSTGEDTAWSGLVNPHFSTGGLVWSIWSGLYD